MVIEGNAPDNKSFDPAPMPDDKQMMPANAERVPSSDVENPEYSSPPNIIEQVQPVESNEKFQQQFKQAAKLGRNFIIEARQREDKALAPYLNQRLFNPEDIKVVQNREQLSSADVAAAKRASLALSLQAADQIALTKLPRQRPEHALKQRTLDDEIISLEKIDGMLGAGFRQAHAMIKEGQTDQLVQQARQVMAYRQKTSPDKIKASDRQILGWVQNTIQAAGKRVCQHRAQAKELWSKSRGGR